MSEWVPVREAAITLGVAEATLKRHIKSGKMQARREEMEKGWRWLVLLDDTPAQTQTEANNGQNDGLVEELRTQNQKLWEQLATRDREVAELHVLLQRAQNVPQLPPPPDVITPVTPASTPAATSVVSQPLIPIRRSFWKRLFGTV